MSGGGARAAYQVGVLRAISDLLPKNSGNPFPIICGTSAGAINAVALAADASNFRRAVSRLMAVWKNFHAQHVYRADPLGVFRNSMKWMFAATSGGLKNTPVSLLDNTPLRRLLTERVDFGSIQRCIDAGDLCALSISASGYTSGQSVCFYQGIPELLPWTRVRRLGLRMDIELDHLMASSAIPFIFPAVRINREYFGDGSMRQIAPISPALHLGAQRVLVIGVGRQLQAQPERVKVASFPTLAEIAGHAMNSIFLDAMEVDLERLLRINRTLSLIPREALQQNDMPLHQVECMVITPSEELEKIAVLHAHTLPATVRMLLSSIGAMQSRGANLVSYLLFEKSYCRALITLGYRDTMARKDALLAFLGFSQ